MVNTSTKQRSQRTTMLEESAGKRRKKQREKEECRGTNQNQYGVYASGKLDIETQNQQCSRAKSEESQENGILKRFKREDERREETPRWERR